RLLQQWDALYGRRMRQRLKKGVDVRDFLIRHNFRCIRRHVASWLADITCESSEGNRIRGQSGPGCSRTLAHVAMTFVSAIACVNPAAVLRVSGGPLGLVGRLSEHTGVF